MNTLIGRKELTPAATPVQFYHVERFETVNKSALKALFKLLDSKVARDMAAFAVLLVYLITGKEKFIRYLGKQRTETLLILGCKPQVIKANVIRVHTVISLLAARSLQFVVGVLVNMPENLVIVHKLGHTDIAKLIHIVCRLEIVGEHLHKQCFTCSGFTYQEYVFVYLVVLIWKHKLGEGAVVEIV